MQAFYSGDGRFRPSGSAVYTEVVNLALAAPGYWVVTDNGQVFGSGAAPSLGGRDDLGALPARWWAWPPP